MVCVPRAQGALAALSPALEVAIAKDCAGMPPAQRSLEHGPRLARAQARAGGTRHVMRPRAEVQVSPPLPQLPVSILPPAHILLIVTGQRLRRRRCVRHLLSETPCTPHDSARVAGRASSVKARCDPAQSDGEQPVPHGPRVRASQPAVPRAQFSPPVCPKALHMPILEERAREVQARPHVLHHSAAPQVHGRQRGAQRLRRAAAGDCVAQAELAQFVPPHTPELPCGAECAGVLTASPEHL